MSEAVHHTPKNTGEHIAPIVSIHSKKEQPELIDIGYRQRIAFEQAAHVLLEDLTNPVHGDLYGVEIAEAINISLSPPRADEAPTRLQAALLELSRLEKEGSYDAYDDYENKVENDVVFQLLVGKLSSHTATSTAKGDSNDTPKRRHAARKLLDLRLYSPDHETASDEDWVNVIDRLFD